MGAGCLVRASGPVTGLFDTGVNASGTPLASGATDPNWTVLGSPVGSGLATVGSLAGTWLGTDSSSQWIYEPSDNGASAYFDFGTSFTVSAGEASTLSITGQYAVDNELVNVFLNGHSLGISDGFPGESLVGFSSFTSFEIPEGSGFVEGTNTIEFETYNDGGPEGLRVEWTGETAAAPGGGSVPDGGTTLAMVGAGLTGLAMLRRRFVK